MAQPPEVDRLADPLVRVIRDAWDGVLAQQQALADDPRLARRRRFLSSMESSISALMDEVDAEAASWLRSTFPETYGRGAVDLRIAQDFTWSQPHVAAVRQMAGATWDDLLHATRFVRRSTKQLVRELGKKEVGATLLAGQTAQQGGRQLARALRERGIWAVTYRDGSRHGLGEYGEMLVRTRSAEAYNAGALNHGVANGVTFFEVFDGAECIAPDTPVGFYGGILGLQRVRYRGPLLRLRTASRPDGLAVGPHHPVLTRRGWLPAHMLGEGDELAHDRRLDGMLLPDDDFQHMPTVEDAFEALRGATVGRVPCHPNDLHGDGAWAEGEVEVVRPAGCLLVEGNAGLAKERREPVLVGSDVAAVPVAAQRQRSQLLLALTPAPGGRVGGADLVAAGLSRCLLPLLDHRAVGGAEPEDPATPLRPGDASAARLALEGHLHHEPLLSVTAEDHDGWVYDATTVNGIYAAGGLVVHNCGWLRHDSGDKANGTIRSAADCAATPLSHPNAVMAGSVVAPLGELQLGYRARWVGPVIEVRTAGGSELTVGPNHPVLTDRGWVAADVLRHGDHVVRRADHPSARTGGDRHQVPAHVEDVFDALGSGQPDARVVAAPDHFHGDGNFCEGEIEVVGPARHLAPVAVAAVVQQLGEAVLVGAGAELPLVAGGGSLGLPGVVVHLAPSSFVRREHIGRVAGPRPDGDPPLSEALPDDVVADADLIGQLRGAGTGEVSLDQVVEVRYVDSWSGHAYDLQTSTGAYWCDGILVHNCRRSFGARPDVSARNAGAARPSTTEAQREDARRFEERRDAEIRARSAQRTVLARREARLARHAVLRRST